MEDEGLRRLTSKIIRRCKPGRIEDEWDDWRLLADGKLCSAAFARLAEDVSTRCGDTANLGPVWLAPANVDDGPYACLALQAHLKWPVTAPMCSKYGVFLHPDPYDPYGHGQQAQAVEDTPLRTVLVDTVFSSGWHAAEAYTIIRTHLQAAREDNDIDLLCIVAVYDNSEDREFTLPDGAGSTVPVVSVVHWSDEEIGRPLRIANQQAIGRIRLPR